MNNKLTKKKLGDPEGDAAASAAAAAAAAGQSVHSKSGSTITAANTQQIEKKIGKLEKTVKALQNKVADLATKGHLPSFGGTGPAKVGEQRRSQSVLEGDSTNSYKLQLNGTP